jgi:hypothetical protein
MSHQSGDASSALRFLLALLKLKRRCLKGTSPLKEGSGRRLLAAIFRQFFAMSL